MLDWIQVGLLVIYAIAIRRGDTLEGAIGFAAILIATGLVIVGEKKERTQNLEGISYLIILGLTFAGYTFGSYILYVAYVPVIVLVVVNAGGLAEAALGFVIAVTKSVRKFFGKRG